MSVFNRLFKLNDKYTKEYQKTNALNVLMDVTHNKLTLSETEKIYNLLSEKMLSINDNNLCIKESMELLTNLKSDWLTKEEKENFVAGVWLCECRTDAKSNKGISYINNEELKYTKQAILGTAFKSINSALNYMNN